MYPLPYISYSFILFGGKEMEGKRGKGNGGINYYLFESCNKFGKKLNWRGRREMEG